MFKRYFVTGLLLWIPIGITLWVLSVVVTAMDQSLALLPAHWNPRVFIGRDVPGLGAILTLVIIFVTGVLTANLVGGKLVIWGEQILIRIPIVRSIYSSVKQVSDTILSPNGNAFRKALLVQYPRKGVWTIAFLTGVPPVDLQEAAGQDPSSLVSVYVPTTPNPTSGFFLMMRKDETTELDMTVDAALKYIVSMGVVSPVVKDEVRTRTMLARR
ncbi:MAG: DUF502 domain-containing protein [Lautropia sp.]